MNEQFKSLLDELSKQPIIATSCDWVECIPSEIWEKHFKENCKGPMKGLDVDRHRWYEISTSVIEIYGKVLGIRHVTNLFSESMDVSDCCEPLEFFEMEEIKTVSYKKLI